MIKLMNADNLEVLKELEENSIDAVITDPPYEIGFMNNKWDKTGIAYNVELWKECLRVLKPGGHLLAFSAARTYHRMAVAIEDAGFEIRDMIEWVYGSGFPKSLDISKAIDKLDAKAARTERNLKFTEWMRTTELTAKQINTITNTVMGGHYLTDKEQPALPTREIFEKLRPIIPFEVPEWVEQMIDERTIESENFKNREIIGETVDGFGMSKIFKSKTKIDNDGKVNVTAPTTSEAKKWEGWGTQLKPAHEPIVLARKPISEKTIAENVLKWGTGAVNIDDCRIEVKGETEDIKIEKGRFPANFIISKEIAPTLDEQSGFSKSNKRCRSAKDKIGDKKGDGFLGSLKYTEKVKGHKDQGGASRFFLNIETEEEDQNITPFYYCSKASPKERGDANNHPTVKPIKLMKYLIELVTPENGVVLDIFMGSGSTGVAAVNTNRNFIGIELDTDYFNIAKERIKREEGMVNNG